MKKSAVKEMELLPKKIAQSITSAIFFWPIIRDREVVKNYPVLLIISGESELVIIV
jgi:hypothetical protein